MAAVSSYHPCDILVDTADTAWRPISRKCYEETAFVDFKLKRMQSRSAGDIVDLGVMYGGGDGMMV